jgi:RNA polymerase sigma factor (sigma-70 family)
MAGSRMRDLLQDIRSTVLEHDGAGLSDGELLACFLRRRDEATFAPLVRRHGPMVWGVCRRILHHYQDTEDAFQATFLVLLRKAASIQPRDMVANWLHGVALRTAWKARALAGKRKARERQLTDVSEPVMTEPTVWREIQPLLDQELSRLPDKYRVTILLCDLEGRTRKEVAQQLRVPEGTVAGRLARARALLARRLARHGLVVSGTALAAALGLNGAEACVPATLMTSTIQTAALLAAGQSATGVVSAPVASLAESVLKLMLLTKLKIMTAVVLGVAAAGVGLMTLAPAQTPSTSPAPAKDGPPSTASAEAASIQRLIGQFASPKFAEREAAATELRRIGEPALGPLREAARGNADLEVKRRAEAVARDILDDSIERLLKEEIREDRAHNQRVARILERVTAYSQERLRTARGATAPEHVPVLADAYLRLARARHRLGESAAAAEAYQQAERFCQDEEKRRVLRGEMTPLLMPVWEKMVRDRMARDRDLKGLASKYPLVLLHSRRYAPLSGAYGQCTYSFLYETANEREHRNDVQILFDNGTGDGTFQVNMVTNQRNAAVDLGNVDFGIDPSPAKVDRAGLGRDQLTAAAGHVYLERVQDTNGNRFFVLFKIVAVDEQSRYVAFVWRRLPGGKIVRGQ